MKAQFRDYRAEVEGIFGVFASLSIFEVTSIVTVVGLFCDSFV